MSDAEIFSTPLADEPSYDDIFSSSVEFASESAAPDRSQGRQAATTPPAAHPRPEIPLHIGRPLLHLSHLSSVQTVLLLGIAVTMAVLVYTLVSGRKHPDVAAPAGESGLPDRQTVRSSDSALGRPSLDRSEFAEGIEPSIPSPEPLSLQLANKLQLNRDYENALVTYDKLYRRLSATDENQPLRDFLLLRMALCSSKSGDVAQADNLFRTVSLSRLPILRALARYYQSTVLLDRKRYLEAATKAYQALGLIEVAQIDEKWVSAVQQECWFLVAEAVSRNLLSLSDADANLPPELWARHPDIDPFVNMDEPQLRVFLTSGTERLDEATLSPQIRGAVGKNATNRWLVICNGASVEELLARFATNAGLNLQWADNGRAATEENLRKRPVYLYLASAAAQQVVTIAAGSVGLLAQLNNSGVLTVLDPTSYSSLSEHTNLLAEESISLWQRFLLASENDQRVPNGHFALATLQAVRGQFGEAIAEYKLVANRFAKHALAPHALFQSGTHKVRLRDYVGAHADFKQLVELYPETPLADRACLHLAEATMKAGLFEEAAGLYRKVYNLGLSAESQAGSALGVGRCSYEMQDYEEAARWLNRYVTLVRDQNRAEFHGACLLLGKSYLALHQPQQAQIALNLALNGDLPRQQYVETVAVLVKACIGQGLFLEALETIEGTSGWQLSQQEAVELLLLRAQVLRSIGLVDKAIAALQEKGQFLPSPELKGKVAVELAACYTHNGDIELARKTLSDAFALVGPGPLAQEIGLELARACLHLGQADQAILVCTQLIEHAVASDVKDSDAAARQPILDLLADAYRKEGKYDQAVATIIDY